MIKDPLLHIAIVRYEKISEKRVSDLGNGIENQRLANMFLIQHLWEKSVVY